jgi:phage tail sheath protein FI
MPTVYQHPGVYINEVPGGSKPIEGVATSVAAFIGFAPAGPANKPIRVTSWLDFSRVFGDPDPNVKTGPYLPHAYLAHAVNGFFSNGGGTCYVVRLGTDDFGGVPQISVQSASQDELFRFVRRNVVRGEDGKVVLGKDGNPQELPAPDPEEDKTQAPGITVTLSADSPAEAKAAAGEGKEGADAEPPATIPTYTVKVTDAAGGDLAEREYTQVTIVPGPKYLAQVINADSKRVIDVKEIGTTIALGDRVLEGGTQQKLDLAWPPAPDLTAVPEEQPSDLIGDPVHGTGLGGLAGTEEITMICVPDLMAMQPTDAQIRDVHAQLTAFCSTGQIKRMAILDPPPGLSKQDIFPWRDDPATPASPFAALYWPWLEVRDPFSGGTMHVPPCGHMAGVWAGTDSDRGVHKAPANVSVQGVVGVATEITDGDQDQLNPAAINCIRAFHGRGIQVWGARTLTNDPEWRYINVRRLFNYVSASILKGTQWAVFEPNDEFLWGQLRVSVGNFLLGVWRGGALFGATPDQAYFVKCDFATNPPDLIEAGQVNIQIGIAPVKPAEFVIFQISQYQAQA